MKTTNLKPFWVYTTTKLTLWRRFLYHKNQRHNVLQTTFSLKSNPWTFPWETLRIHILNYVWFNKKKHKKIARARTHVRALSLISYARTRTRKFLRHAHAHALARENFWDMRTRTHAHAKISSFLELWSGWRFRQKFLVLRTKPKSEKNILWLRRPILDPTPISETSRFNENPQISEAPTIRKS